MKEKERANVDLLRRISPLSVEKREADEKHTKLQANLDRELVAQRSRKSELNRLRMEFQASRCDSRNCLRLRRT